MLVQSFAQPEENLSTVFCMSSVLPFIAQSYAKRKSHGDCLKTFEVEQLTISAVVNVDANITIPKALVCIAEYMMLNRVGASTQSCLTPSETEKGS